MPVQSQISKLLAAGYVVAKSDGGWLASYQNGCGKMHEIGIFSDQKKAERAAVLWAQGFRFGEMRAEYDAGKTLAVISEKWGCCAHWVRECVILAGGIMRTPARQRTGGYHKKSTPYAGEKLKEARERMRRTRTLRHKRIDAFADDTAEI